jgi:hypothetical protein
MTSRCVGLVAQINSRTAPDLPHPRERRRDRARAATLLAELTGQRHQGQGRLARALARKGALRGKLKERDAAAIIAVAT